MISIPILLSMGVLRVDYLAQLKDGYMLVVENDLVFKEYTGYPYKPIQFEGLTKSSSVLDFLGLISPYNYIKCIPSEIWSGKKLSIEDFVIKSNKLANRNNTRDAVLGETKEVVQLQKLENSIIKSTRLRLESNLDDLLLRFEIQHLKDDLINVIHWAEVNKFKGENWGVLCFKDNDNTHLFYEKLKSLDIKVPICVIKVIENNYEKMEGCNLLVFNSSIRIENYLLSCSSCLDNVVGNGYWARKCDDNCFRLYREVDKGWYIRLEYKVLEGLYLGKDY